MLRQVRRARPDIEREYREARQDNYKRPYLNLEEVTDEEIRLVKQAVPRRVTHEKKRKLPRDRLISLQCAIFHEDGWSDEQIAQWLGKKTEATARNYVKAGLRV